MMAKASDLPPDVQTYLESVPEAARGALLRLRQLIIAAAPEAVESLSYGVPAFKYMGRPLVSYGAGKAHCAFYVQSPALMDTIHDDLTAYDVAKGTIRFTPERPLPEQLVTKVVQARMAETEAAESERRAKARARRK